MTRIVHVSDLHYELAPERLKPGVRQLLDQSVPILKETHPDLVVVTGDLTSYGCFDRNQLVGVHRWLEELGLAYLAIPGNHDFSANVARGNLYPIMETYEAVPWDQTNFAQTFHQGPLVTVQEGPLTLLAVALREGDPDGSLAQLAVALQNLDGPAIVLGHYPLVVTKDVGVLATFGYQGYIDAVRDQLLNLLLAQPLVRAYLCGHVHAQTVTVLDGGLVQLSAGGLGPGASAGWVIDVVGANLEVRSLRGGGPEIFWPGEMLGDCDSLDYHLWCGSEPLAIPLGRAVAS
ncbi:metallophosphoesterase [Ferrimicrobium sp.]|uniref:metallophosphoesterase family protein n=1 Tax=Ferrimicrobium sp. TaxID=2926050 RepID=UPI0026270993|nr:metallophosphoesterase [Ferrimicrobium sp.]